MNQYILLKIRQKCSLFLMILADLPKRYNGLGDVSRIHDSPKEGEEEGREEEEGEEEGREEEDGYDTLQDRIEEEGRADCVGTLEAAVVVGSKCETISTILVVAILFMYPISDDSNLLKSFGVNDL